MKRFLYFGDSADDAACWPADNLISMVCDANATVKLRFKSADDDSDNVGDLATLTITADKQLEVMRGISEAISEGPSFIVICDDLHAISSSEADSATGKFIHPDILSCTITIDT